MPKKIVNLKQLCRLYLSSIFKENFHHSISRINYLLEFIILTYKEMFLASPFYSVAKLPKLAIEKRNTQTPLSPPPPKPAWMRARSGVGPKSLENRPSTREFRSDTVHDSAGPFTSNLVLKARGGRRTTEDIHQHQWTFALFSRSFLGIFSPRLYSVAGSKLSPDSPPLRQPAAVTDKPYLLFWFGFFFPLSFFLSFFLSLFQVEPNRKQCRRVKA
jgi:hypothetical protein